MLFYPCPPYHAVRGLMRRYQEAWWLLETGDKMAINDNNLLRNIDALYYAIEQEEYGRATMRAERLRTMFRGTRVQETFDAIEASLRDDGHGIEDERALLQLSEIRAEVKVGE